MSFSILTVSKARMILGAPLKFGDAQQIEAVHLLQLLDDVTALNDGKTVVEVDCPTCEGTGEFDDCECGNHHDCPCCYGSGSSFRNIDTLDKAELSRIMDELQAQEKVA